MQIKRGTNGTRDRLQSWIALLGFLVLLFGEAGAVQASPKENPAQGPVPGEARPDTMESDNADTATEEAEGDSQSLLPEKPTPKDVQTLFDEARSLFETRQCKKALPRLYAVEDSHYGRSYRARVRLISGICQLDMNQVDQAVDSFNSALPSWRTIGDRVRYLLGEARFRQGEYGKARYNFDKLIEQYPDSLWVDDALVMSVACDLARDRYGSVINRVWSTLKEKKEKAEAECKQDRRCRTPEEYEKQGDLLWLKAQGYRGRKEFLKEARTLLAILVDGKAAQYRDRVEKRLVELREQGVDYIPPFGPSLLGLVGNLRQVWSLDEVVAEVSSALSKVTPESPDYNAETSQRLRYHRGRAFYFLQRYEDARKDFAGLLEELPQTEDDRRPTTMNQLAKTLVRLDRSEEALAMYRTIHKRYPDHWAGDQGLFMVAWTYAETNEFTKALTALDLYEKAYPSRGSFSDKISWFRAWFTYRQGDIDQALTLFMALRQGKKKTETTRKATYWAARCLQKKQREQEAEVLYRELAEEDQFRYYRLAAMQRLRLIDQVRRAVNEMDVWSATDLDGDGDHDLEQQEQAAALLDGDGEQPEDTRPVWKQISGVDREVPPYSLVDLRRGFAEHQTALTERRDGAFKYALYRLRKEAKKHEETFPVLRRAIMWRDLGDRFQAGDEMAGFAEELLTLWRERRRPLRRGTEESDEEFALRQKKQATLTEFSDRFYMDMVSLFMDCEQPYWAYKVFAGFFSYKAAPGITLDLRRKIFYPVAFPKLIERNAERYDVPDDLVLSIMRTESRFFPKATSNVGAMGLMQVMPHTGARIAERIQDNGPDRLKLYQPRVTIRYGTWYLSALLKKFQRQLPLAIASYNGGPQNVSLWLNAGKNLVWDEFIESIGFSQTRHYTKTVLLTMAVYRLLYAGEFDSWNLAGPIDPRMEDNINW